MDLSKVNWVRLKEANELFTPFAQGEKETAGFYGKLIEFMNHLKDKYLYLDDEFRNASTIQQIVGNYMSGNSLNIFYEIGDFQGLTGFTHIVPGFKAGILFKLWDKKLWGKDTARKMIDLAVMVMDEFKLKRIYLDTPDERMMKMAKLIGFKLEGEAPMAFRWNQKFYTLYHLGLVKDGG